MLIYKIASSFIILLTTLVFGLLPIIAAHKKYFSERFFYYAESFAGGIFIGAAVFHLLPDAIAQLPQPMPQFTHYHVIGLSLLTCGLLFTIEKGLTYFSKRKLTGLVASFSYLITIMLSIHSLFEGLALGITATITGFLIVFFAIIAHKGADAFALGMNLRNSSLSMSHTIKLVVLFSFITPLGIMAGSSITALLPSSHMAEIYFNAIAAGTFFYIGICSQNFIIAPRQHFNVSTLSYYCSGMGIMWMLAMVA